MYWEELPATNEFDRGVEMVSSWQVLSGGCALLSRSFRVKRVRLRKDYEGAHGEYAA
jgi:hypothetical protein